MVLVVAAVVAVLLLLLVLLPLVLTGEWMLPVWSLLFPLLLVHWHGCLHCSCSCFAIAC